MSARTDLDTFAQIARGSLLLLIARATFFLCGLLTAIVVSRFLGPVDFGIYGLVFTLVTWLQVMLTGGLAGATTKVLTEHADRRHAVEQTALAVLTVLGAILFALGYAASAPLTRFFGAPSAAPALRIAFLDVPLMALVGAWQGTLYAAGRYDLLALTIAAHGVLKATGIAALALIHALSVEAAFLVHVASSLIVIVLLMAAQPPRAVWPSTDLARALLRRAIPLALYIGVAQLHLNLPLWLLAAVMTASPATGFYVAALNVSRTLTLVPAALSAVAFSAISRAIAMSDEARAREQLALALRLALLLLLPAVALVSIEAEPLVLLLFGSAYGEAATILPWQMLAFSLFALLDVIVNGLAAAGVTVAPALSLACLLLPAAALSLLLILSSAAVGAGVAHALSMTFGLGLVLLFALRRFRPFLPWASLGRVASSTLLAALVCFLMPSSGIWVVVTLAFAFAVYLLALFFLQELRFADFAAAGISRQLVRRPRA